MKTLNRISDLEQYGLEYLTGEACALSHRLLFDMNADGATLMCEYFGLPCIEAGSQTWRARPPFASNWNTRVNGKPAVVSILLPRNPEFYRELFKFLLFREGYEIVTVWDGLVTGMSTAEREENLGYSTADGVSIYRNPRTHNQPSVGTRNVHAMSQRST
jgi:hypothetical protein